MFLLGQVRESVFHAADLFANRVERLHAHRLQTIPGSSPVSGIRRQPKSNLGLFSAGICALVLLTCPECHYETQCIDCGLRSRCVIAEQSEIYG